MSIINIQSSAFKYMGLLLFMAICTISCSSGKKSTAVNKEVQSLEELCRAFILALNEHDLKPLDPYMPDVAVAKKMAPKETEGLSDTEIETILIGDLREKLLSNMANIRKNLDDQNEQILMGEIEVEPSDGESLFPDVVSIAISTSNKNGRVPITFLELDERFFIFEILVSVSVLK